MILNALAVGPLAANCFIIGDSATLIGAIIDPGGDADRILQSVEEAVEEAEVVMKRINGRVIVLPYYPPQSSTAIKNLIKGVK